MMKRDLQFRVPNPPPYFVGRKEELRWLGDVSQSSLVAIAGPRGIGKTSMVLQHLLSKEEQDRALFVAVRPEDPLESVLRRLLWALAGSSMEVDAPFFAREPEEAVFKAIALADEGEARVVLDDIDNIKEKEHIEEIFIQIANFARSSRWFVTARALPMISELQGRSFVLPGLDEVMLIELGSILSPHADPASVRRAAVASKGSPWVFKQYLLAGDAALDSARSKGLAGLDGASLSLLNRMAILRLPMPSSILAMLCSGDLAPSLAILSRRGLIVQEGSGYRAHDVVAGLLGPMEEDLHGLTSRLAASHAPRAWLEALRIQVHQGDIHAAVELLERSGQELLARGEAPRLWTILRSTPDERLHLWQVRCASELGHATVLAAVGPPKLETSAQSFEWACMLYLQGDPTQALSVLDEVGRSETKGFGEDRGIDELGARCLIALGRASEAQANLLPRGGHGALLAYALAITDPEAAGPAPPQEPSLQEIVDLARAAFFRGELARAERLLEDTYDSGGGPNLSLFLWREATLLQTRLDIAAGRLSTARARLDHLRPFVRGPTLLRPMWMLLDAELRIVTGQLAGLSESLDHARELALEMDHLLLAPLDVARAALLRLQGRGQYSVTATPAKPAPVYDGFERVESLRRSLLSGGDVVEPLLSIASHAKRDGLALLHAEALNACCEVFIIRGSPYEHSTSQLLELAEAVGSERYAAAARYYLGLDRPAATEVAAASADLCTARRARARLGEQVTLDDLDLLLQRAAPTFSGPVTTLGSTEPWGTPAWGLWDERQIVWTPDGREIDLSRRALLYRLLSTLFDAGGEADKEYLISMAWGEREYHPLHHDQKLFVAVRTIRSKIERQKSIPEFLLTTEDGYALRQPVRRVISNS